MTATEYLLESTWDIQYVEGTEIMARRKAIRTLKAHWNQMSPAKDKYGKVIPERAWGFRDVKISKAVRIKGIRQYIGIGMVLYDPKMRRLYWMIYGDKTIRILDEEGKIKGKI